MKIFYDHPSLLQYGRDDGVGGKKTVVEVDEVQTLTNKTLTAPTINGAVGGSFVNPTFTGTETENAAAGAAQSLVTLFKSATNLPNNTATDFDVACVASVPNANHVGTIAIELHCALGDQDSAEGSFWIIAISRIAGAAAKATVSAKTGAANTTGATANAAGTITAVVAGAAGAVNTINVKVTVARSAGASSNHDALARITLMNTKASGITIS